MIYEFSNKVNNLAPSAIREILKYTSEPGIISFAAGNPSSNAFPIEEISEISKEIFEKFPELALQYSITEWYQPLRELLKEKIAIDGNFSEKNSDDLIITSGAQQANELSAKVLCNENDTILCEAPSFIGSLNSFRSYRVNLVGVPMEEDGISINALAKAIKNNKNIKLLYTIPNFQNPTGCTMSLYKRKTLLEFAKRNNFVILEDNPYGDLRWNGEPLPSIKSFDTDGFVIYTGSFSKILSPGLRVGYVSANKEIISKITVCKQVSDVHTNIWAQLICEQWLEKSDINSHLKKLREIYRQKCSLMIHELSNSLDESITFTKPEGGLFIWVTMPDSVDVNLFCKKLVEEHKVAVVPGNAFSIDENKKTNSFRLNFSTPSEEDIVKGCRILGNYSKTFLNLTHIK
ncbi:MAG: PLP-dependent aminotransferase family protein [Ruminococcus sp.]|jgi:2-aminoadipate transaminase|nr:PLP-dependent aminotransferase family protein [Ruminococcus sp.]